MLSNLHRYRTTAYRLLTMFGSEMVGAVRGIDPETGHHFDDTKRYIDEIPWVSAGDKRKIFELNVRKVYPRIAPLIDEKVLVGSGVMPL